VATTSTSNDSHLSQDPLDSALIFDSDFTFWLEAAAKGCIESEQQFILQLILLFLVIVVPKD